MRRLLAGCFVLIALLVAAHAQARDTEYHLKIDEVMHDPEYSQKLGSDVVFSFGTQNAPAIDQNFGEFTTHRTANSFGKPDEAACRRAMASALIELRERTVKLGGNAVVNIVSFYKGNTRASETDYECHAGAIVAGVELKGTVVKVKR
jgi:hypothetical protein